MMSGLNLLRSLLLHGPSYPELGPLVAVFHVEADHRVRAQALSGDVQQLGIKQGLYIPE